MVRKLVPSFPNLLRHAGANSLTFASFMPNSLPTTSTLLSSFIPRFFLLTCLYKVLHKANQITIPENRQGHDRSWEFLGIIGLLTTELG